VNEIVALLLVVLLAVSGYAAGRMHAQFGYRVGYRFGYRQGYFDGDLSSWNRRRKESQAAVASALTTVPTVRAKAYPGGVATGTTYLSSASDRTARHGNYGDLLRDELVSTHG
jgi:hypothetical protein